MSIIDGRDIAVLADRVKDIEGHLARIAQALEDLVTIHTDRDSRIMKSPEVFERISDSLETVAKVLDEDNLNVRALLLPDEQPIKVRRVGVQLPATGGFIEEEI